MKRYFCVFSVLFCLPVEAGVGRIYEPYVNPLENELEFHSTYETGDQYFPADLMRNTFGFGTPLTDNIKSEFALVYSDNALGETVHRASEVEFLWQLSEQGEYDNDWGAMFSLERNHLLNYWSTNSKLVMHRDFTHSSIDLNLVVGFDWGHGIENDYDLELRSRYSWRWRRELTPSIEFHTSESYTVLGPMVGGALRLSSQHKLNWNLGILYGLDENTPSKIFKLECEWEFF